ncbi:MAG: hypothetical protein GX301_02815 [Gracilibacteraceae bacterium]|jgi:hypothetical protein|nr:hypothetical protein [Gracilibacteraceae bacterium]
MCCDENRKMLHEYALGKLSELESHAVAKHLKSCDRCRRELAEIKELKAFLKSDIQKNIRLPADLKFSIMSSIDLKRYKKSYKNTLGELANWGMSLVAAGLILLILNMAPREDLVRVQNDLYNTGENITKRISQPLSSINERIDKLTYGITQLDGIVGRIEKEKEGGK